MTANVTIEIARRSNVLRIPNAALRFRPTTDMFAALKHAGSARDLNRGWPAAVARPGGSGGGRRGGNGAPAADGAGAGQTAAQPVRRSFHA